MSSTPEAYKAGPTFRKLALHLLADAGAIVRNELKPYEQYEALLTAESRRFLRHRHLYGLAMYCHTRDAEYSIYRKVSQVQQAALAELIQAASQAGIELLLYKSSEVVKRYYGGEPIALRGDLDVIVKPGSMARMKSLLEELGYRQAKFDTDSLRLVPVKQEQIAKFESNGYALVSYGRLAEFELDPVQSTLSPGYLHPAVLHGNRATVAVAIDVAIGLDKHTDAGRLWEKSTESIHGTARAISVEDQLWYTATMLYLGAYMYKETYKLCQLADMAVILSQAQVRWDRLIAEARTLEILPSVYYPLAFLAKLCKDVRIPEDVLAELSPTKGSRARDYGWQIPKLFGEIDPLPYELSNFQ